MKNKRKITSGEKSRTSPKSGNTRACLCNDGTYNTKCCNGSLKAQGVGKTKA